MVLVSHGLIKSTLSTKPEYFALHQNTKVLWKDQTILSFKAFKFKSTSGSRYTTEKLDYKGTGELRKSNVLEILLFKLFNFWEKPTVIQSHWLQGSL